MVFKLIVIDTWQSKAFIQNVPHNYAHDDNELEDYVYNKYNNPMMWQVVDEIDKADTVTWNVKSTGGLDE